MAAEVNYIFYHIFYHVYIGEELNKNTCFSFPQPVERYYVTHISIQCRYAVERYSFEFVMKVDDDTFINQRLLFDFLFTYIKPKFTDNGLAYYGGKLKTTITVLARAPGSCSHVPTLSNK